MQDWLTMELFQKLIGDTFEFESESARFSAILAEVTALDAVGERQRRQPFSMVFQAEDREHCPQCMYRARHQRMEEFTVFLVPIGPGQRGMCYEAIFN